MTPVAAPADLYRDDLNRWSGFLAAGRMKEFQAELAANPAGHGARIYRAIAVGERGSLLRQELGMVALAFPDFPALVDAYIRAAPRTSFDLEYNDSEQFLNWLQETRPFTPQQAAFVGYQLGEYAVLGLARRDRVGHVRFQRRLRADPAVPVPPEGAGYPLRLHLNPIRVWRELLAPEPGPHLLNASHNLLFYAAATEVGVLRLELEQQDLLENLADLAPCTLDEWSARTGSDGARERELAVQLAAQGVLALAG